MTTVAGEVNEHDTPPAGDRFSLELPAEPSSIRTARLFAGAVSRHFGADEDTVEDVKLVISEACTNAVKAHQHGDVEDTITVRATRYAAVVTFEVIDAGPGFTPPPIEESRTPPGGLYEGSLGLTLIRSLFESVEFAPNPGRGMTVRFSVETRPDVLDEVDA